jgi:hypothetical protein
MAAAQTAANKEAIRESARVNAVNLITPYGAVTYDRNPDGTPRSQVTSLSPVGQQLFNQQNAITGELLGQAYGSLQHLPGDPFSLAGMPYSPTSVDTSQMPMFDPNALPYNPRTYGDIASYVDEAGDAAFRQAMRYVEPGFEAQLRTFEQRMADQGLPTGGEAYSKTLGSILDTQNRARLDAADRATQIAGQEATRRLGMEQGLRETATREDLQGQADWLQRLQTEQALRSQAIQEYLLGRTQPMSEASMYLQGSPGFGMPQAPPMPQYNMQAPDIIGASLGAYNAAMQGYNANLAQQGSMWQGVAALAGTGARLALKSARESKWDIGKPERILDRLATLPVHSWRYKDDPRGRLHIGPMADDWADRFGGNYREIDVVDAIGVLIKAVQELYTEVCHARARVETRDADPSSGERTAAAVAAAHTRGVPAEPWCPTHEPR